MDCEAHGFSFRHLLLLIGITERTGELFLESGNNIGSVIFYQGNVLQAFSPYSRTIGDLLVEQGLVTEAGLLEMLQLQKQEGEIPIGHLFVRSGTASLEIIESLVHEQVRTALREFSCWPGLHATFVQKEIAPFDRIHFPLREFLIPDDFKMIENFLAETNKTHGGNVISPAQSPAP